MNKPGLVSLREMPDGPLVQDAGGTSPGSVLF
jgi:hypothetical protein